MKTCYVFDVDETLQIGGGPIPFGQLVGLRDAGHIVGLCGNWALVTLNLPGWHTVISFVGPISLPKDEFLKDQIAHYIPADEYVMVGNVLGVSGTSDDEGAAKRAGWRFIKESDFARGVR